jgi:hypothetical protein
MEAVDTYKAWATAAGDREAVQTVADGDTSERGLLGLERRLLRPD